MIDLNDYQTDVYEEYEPSVWLVLFRLAYVMVIILLLGAIEAYAA